MEINWVTVAAQIVNFLILVWLLHKFLYSPIARAMERREERIRKLLKDAEAEQREAEQARRRLEAAKSALDAEEEKLLARARAAADDLRRLLEKQARDDTDSMRKAWFDQLAADREEFLADIRRRAADEILLVCREALKAFADESLEERIVAAFTRRLEELPDQSQEKLKEAVRRHKAGIKVESAFAVPAQARQLIRQSVGRAFEEDVDVEFAEVDDLIAGVRLRVDSQTIEWSLNSYLDQLNARLSAALAAAHLPESKRAAE